MKDWWKRRTLRFRLALWYALGGTVLLTVFSATLYVFVARRLALSPPLRQDLEQIRARLTVAPDGRIHWDGTEVPPAAIWDTHDPWFELWDEQGRLVRRFWPFTEYRLDRMPVAPARGSDTLSVFRIAAGIPLRTFATPYPVPAGEWMIRVMRNHEPAADALGALLAIILVSLPLVVVLLVTGGYLITRHWLKPLERMALQAERITVDNLGERLSAEEAEGELGRLAAAFNLTLARLEDSFGTLDRFVADASHELRTPLTTLRSVGEVGLHRDRTVTEYREIIGSMLEEAERLNRLVERLLELASMESGGKALHREPLRLDRFVSACVQEIGILAEYKSQQIGVAAVACSVVTDPVLLRQALQNLIDNAMKYSPIGATIHIAVAAANGECWVSVSDEGPGIPSHHFAQLANRFYRVDDSRVRGRGGFGLGLAITKAYMHALGGRLECRPGDTKGSCFSLVLPAASGH